MKKSSSIIQQLEILFFQKIGFPGLALLFALGLQAQTCPGNLAQNPGFETGTTANWNTAGTVTIVNDAVSGGGTKAARLESTSQHARVYQTLAAASGNTYILKVQAKRSANTVSAYISLKFMNASFSPLQTDIHQSITSATYAEASKTLTAPAGTVWVEISVNKDPGAGSITCDEICLTTGNAGNLPDLIVFDAALSASGTVTVGDEIPAEVSIFNQGTAAAAGSEVRFYISSDGVLDANDDVIGIFQFAGVAAGQVSPTVFGSVTIPGNLSPVPGTWRIFAAADTNNNNVQESDETNNSVLVGIFNVLPSSTTCQISASISNLFCNDNGTTANPSDDTYSFDITVTSNVHCSSGWLFTDGTQFGDYGVPTHVGPFPISGGNKTFNIRDQFVATATTSGTATAPATCSNGGNSNGECAFSRTYFTVSGFQTSVNQIDANIAQAGGYQIGVVGNAPGTLAEAVRFQDLRVSTVGDLQTSEEGTFPTVPNVTNNVARRFGSFRPVLLPTNLPHEVHFKLQQTDGSFILDQKLPFTGLPTTVTGINGQDVFRLDDGYLIAGQYINQTPTGTTFNPFLIKTGFQGNKLWQASLPNVGDFFSAKVLEQANDGGFYIQIGTTANLRLLKTAANGQSQQWSTVILSDFPSNKLSSVAESADGTSILIATTESNSNGFIRKLNAATGLEIWKKSISTIFPRAGVPFYQSFPSGALPLADGSMVVQFSFFDVGIPNPQNGQAIAKIDANGNAVWVKFSANITGKPVLEALDGSLIFVDAVQGTPLKITKTTSGGEILPNCATTLLLPELKIANLVLTSPSPTPQGGGFTVKYSILNSGNAPTLIAPAIKAYFSTDNVLSTNDLVSPAFIGPTATLSGGLALANLNGVGDLPTTLAPGSYFLILKIDANDQIAEVSEANNTAAVPITVVAVPNTGCAFSKTYGPAIPEIFSYAGSENATQFTATIGHGSFGNNNETKLVTDKLGNQISKTTAPPTASTADVLATSKTADNKVRVERKTAAGAVVWSQIVDLQLVGTIHDIYLASSVRTWSGWIFFGSVPYTPPGGSVNFYHFSYFIKADGTGLVRNQMTLTEFAPFGHFQNLPAGGNNWLVVHQNQGALWIRKFNGTGAEQWVTSIAGDLPSNSFRSVRVNPDSSAVFVANRNNLVAVVAKYSIPNVPGGQQTIWGKSIGSVFSPGVFTFGEEIRDLLPLADGSLITGYHYTEPGTTNSGFEYGRLDPSGNAVWWRRIGTEFDLAPILATSDGGSLWAGSNNGQLALVKMTSLGLLTPECTGNSGGVDLELTASSATPNPAQWSFFSAKFDIKNNGTAPATGIKVKLNLPAGMVYRGGQEFTATQGSFNFWQTHEWTVGNLAAGATASLTVNYFNTTTSAKALFGQVSAQNEADADSQPNNNNGTTPAQDDEAVLNFNGNAPPTQLPDLNLANLTMTNPSLAAGQILNFKFDLKNTGTGNAPGNFSVKAYISTDNQLSNNDLQDGTIQTGNINAGATVPQVVGASTVPANLSPGNYFLILKVDADGQIAESNENNNVLTSATTFTVTGGGGGNKPDLSLTLVAAPQNPGQWQNTVLTLTLKNTGTVAATGVTVDFPAQSDNTFWSKLAYQSHTAAAGTNFNSWTGLWTVGNVAPGETKTLIYNGFTKVGAQIPVFSQVKTASPADADSAPGNNSTGTPAEDDEARVVVNSNSLLAPGDREIGNWKLEIDELPDFQVFPNPASDEVFVKIPESADVQIFNQFGQSVGVVVNEDGTPRGLSRLDLRGLPSGQYFLKIQIPGERAVFKKLIVSKL